MKVWNRARIELETPESAVRHASVARHVVHGNEIGLVPRTDKQLRYQLSPYFANTMIKLFKNSTRRSRPDINSIENSVDPDQLTSDHLIRIYTVSIRRGILRS